ncbi:nuclear transport factor 2 family protein [Sphaerisporangium corydalis]|uniref:Nuclear transport factor 2 family protein n=1 Tax=Sphaerisporangium corydalis TaxID=1441875 RepID=A0ABV9E7N1_9ACTN|nr:nuclear transport factor 2 family protein [Sphaerisporangium corydalis]
MPNSRTPESRGDEHQELIRKFYDAFALGDTDAMSRCYHPDVSFGDPVFRELEGRERVMGMWRMLLAGNRAIEVETRDIAADNHSGTAHWTARYVFSRTGRRVVNEVDAQFRFDDGLIVRHHDEFDFRHWSRMALGRPTSLMLALVPALRRRLRDQARGGLEEYLRSNSPISG